MVPVIHKPMNATEAPARYPALTLDRMLHLARHLHDGQSRYLVTFSGRLDTERIARAFELSLDAEPVLGCRFVDHPWRPYWERLPCVKRVSPLSIVETDNEHSVHAWLGAPLDASAGVQVRASLFRRSTEKLAVKLSHEAADFGGSIDYLGILSTIYRELRTNPAYVPRPRTARLGQGPVLRGAGFRQLLRGCFHFSAPNAGIDFGVSADGIGEPAFAERHLEPDGFLRIREYCRTRGTTINEVALAAFYRAHFQVFAPPAGAKLTIPIPVNLRRHLPADSSAGVCNLPAIFFAGVKDQRFDALAADVRRLMASARLNTPWLGQAVLVELMFLLPYALLRWIARRRIPRQIASGKIYPYISNDGIIDTRRFDFGDPAICDFDTWGPVPNHPLPTISVYSVGDKLKTSIATRDRPNGRWAERLLDAYMRELPGQAPPAAS